MQETNKSFTSDVLSGVLFGAMTLNSLMLLFRRVNFLTLLYLAAYAFTAFSLFKKQRDVKTACGFGTLALLSLYSLTQFYSNKLTSFLNLAAYAILTLMVLSLLTPTIPNLKDTLKKFWYIPALCSAISLPVALILMIIGHYSALWSIVMIIVRTAAIYFASKWIVESADLPVDENTASAAAPKKSYTAAASVSAPDAYCSLVAHILLMLFTCGIWTYVWIYRTTAFLNGIEGEEDRNPATKLLLCMFIPFYAIYWIYKSSQRIDKLAAQKGISSDIATICLIMAIFVPIVSFILMQDKINAIATCADGNTVSAAPKAEPAPEAAPETAPEAAPETASAPITGAADELEKFKRLLDNGAITQEEYDAKKKQLLGL